jgi:hypothetical protein
LEAPYLFPFARTVCQPLPPNYITYYMIKVKAIDMTNIGIGKNLLNYCRIKNGSTLRIFVSQGTHMHEIMSTCKNVLARNSRINGRLVNPSLLAGFK